jgi:chemotaxis protein MotA
MDIATVIGLILGLGAMVGTMLIEGGNPMSLLNVPAAVIVFGGSVAALFVAFPLKQIMKLPAYIGQCFKTYNEDLMALVELFVKLADQARRDGLLSLEQEGRSIEDPFIRKGVMLIVDGVDPSVVHEVMETDTDQVAERHREGQEMLKALGGFGPTMGIIGTVMGLITVLSNLSDPGNLGHSIATAFIATLYGVASANIMWLPMANKLKHKNQVEIISREVSRQGVLAVQAGENPRIVREKLESFLAPKLRGQNANKEE